MERITRTHVFNVREKKYIFYKPNKTDLYFQLLTCAGLSRADYIAFIDYYSRSMARGNYYEVHHVRYHSDYTPYLQPTATQSELAFLTPCDQAFNPPFLGGKIIELAKFCFKNKRFGPNLSFFSKQVIVSHCV